MDDILAHLNGMRALSKSVVSVPSDVLRDHLDGAGTAVTLLQNEMRTLKRKVDASQQQVLTMRKFLPVNFGVKIVPCVENKNVSTCFSLKLHCVQ